MTRAGAVRGRLRWLARVREVLHDLQRHRAAIPRSKRSNAQSHTWKPGLLLHVIVVHSRSSPNQFQPKQVAIKLDRALDVGNGQPDVVHGPNTPRTIRAHLNSSASRVASSTTSRVDAIAQRELRPGFGTPARWGSASILVRIRRVKSNSTPSSMCGPSGTSATDTCSATS